MFHLSFGGKNSICECADVLIMFKRQYFKFDVFFKFWFVFTFQKSYGMQD